MSLSPQGWYEDDDAPGLARWWDGDRWTEHTMVLPITAESAPTEATTEAAEADLGYFALPGDDLQPLPPQAGPTRFPRTDEDEFSPFAAPRPNPTQVGALELGSFGDLEDSNNPFFAPEPAIETGVYRPDWLGADMPARHRAPSGGGGDSGRFARRFRSWPRWARIVAPVLAIALLVGLAVAAAGSIGSGNGSSSSTTVTTVAAPSSTTTAVTFVPLEAPSSSVTSTTVAPSSTTHTTAVRAAATTTTAKAITTTTTASTTSTTSTPTSTTAAPPESPTTAP